ncbi:hypothetical protein Taro_046687, partial [Colocasia esculenta]|nr:hypothetical protein [Colocasia esculenta]
MSSPFLGSKVWSCIATLVAAYLLLWDLLIITFPLRGSPAESDLELVDHFEDWFSDVDLTLVDVNSGVLTADSGQALDLWTLQLAGR